MFFKIEAKIGQEWIWEISLGIVGVFKTEQEANNVLKYRKLLRKYDDWRIVKCDFHGNNL